MHYHVQKPSDDGTGGLEGVAHANPDNEDADL